MKYIDADLLRKEIERRKNNAPLHYHPHACTSIISELEELLASLDTLEAEERPEPYIPVYDKEYLTEKQRLFKEHHGEVDVDKMLAECRGYDEEKEEPKSLEQEIETWIPAHINVKTDETLQANPTEIANARRKAEKLQRKEDKQVIEQELW